MPKKLFKLFVIILALAFLLAAYLSISLPLTFEVDGKTYKTVITTGRKAIKMPKDPLKEGYVFDGWYWDKDVWEQPFTNSLSDTPIRKSATVYAKWKKEAHVHSFGEWTVVTAATCTEEGTEKRVCECGEAETRVIENLPHSFGEWTVVTAANCTTEGLEKRVCECGEAETRAIAKLAHTYVVKHDATNHWKECSVCHEEIDKAAHSFGEWTVETAATCTTEGTDKRVCECGEAETRITEKLPHSFGEWTVVTAANCITEGLEKRLCECGEAETRAIAKLAHTYVVTHDATNHWSECSVCDNKKDEAAHTYENDVCTVCGSEYVTIGLKYRQVSGGYEVAGIGIVKESRIVIPSTYEGEPVIGIRGRAFNRCSGLVSIKIPSGVTSIGVNAFAYCSSLTKVEISDIAAWCEIEFVGRFSNPLETAKHLYINGEEVTELVIPEGVTSIGDTAFYNCSSLVSIEIPSGVTSIGSYAFRGCSSLVSVEIPSSVTSIGSYAFRGCSSLEAITVAEGNTEYHSAGNCLIETKTKTLIAGCKNSIIPADGSVTSIGDYAFYNCSSLLSVEIPSSVTSIGRDAFYGTGIWNDTAENDVVYADKWAVGYKGTLTNITLLADTVGIVPSAFSYCTSLVTIEIPKSVTSIGDRAFDSCSNLQSFVYGGTKAEWIAITKGDSWNYNTGNYTVTCTGGTLTKEESAL